MNPLVQQIISPVPATISPAAKSLPDDSAFAVAFASADLSTQKNGEETELLTHPRETAAITPDWTVLSALVLPAGAVSRLADPAPKSTETQAMPGEPMPQVSTIAPDRAITLNDDFPRSLPAAETTGKSDLAAQSPEIVDNSSPSTATPAEHSRARLPGFADLASGSRETVHAPTNPGVAKPDVPSNLRAGAAPATRPVEIEPVHPSKQDGQNGMPSGPEAAPPAVVVNRAAVKLTAAAEIGPTREMRRDVDVDGGEQPEGTAKPERQSFADAKANDHFPTSVVHPPGARLDQVTDGRLTTETVEALAILAAGPPARPGSVGPNVDLMAQVVGDGAVPAPIVPVNAPVTSQPPVIPSSVETALLYRTIPDPVVPAVLARNDPFTTRFLEALLAPLSRLSRPDPQTRAQTESAPVLTIIQRPLADPRNPGSVDLRGSNPAKPSAASSNHHLTVSHKSFFNGSDAVVPAPSDPAGAKQVPADQTTAAVPTDALHHREGATDWQTAASAQVPGNDARPADVAALPEHDLSTYGLATQSISPTALNSRAPINSDAAVPQPATVPQPIAAESAGPNALVVDGEELGRLSFDLSRTGDQMNIHVLVERPETMELLRRHSEQLIAEFRQAGFSGANLTFSQSDQGPARDPKPQSLPQPEPERTRQIPPAENLAHPVGPTVHGLDLRL